MDDNDEPILGATTLRFGFELLCDRAAPVHWNLMAQAPEHRTDFLEVLQVGLRLMAPQPASVTEGGT